MSTNTYGRSYPFFSSLLESYTGD